MSRRFVILTHSASAIEQQAIRGALGTLGWWHHLPQSWLVIDPSESVTLVSLRDKIIAAAPSMTFYILEIPVGSTWGGKAPVHMREWLDTEWVK